MPIWQSKLVNFHFFWNDWNNKRKIDAHSCVNSIQSTIILGHQSFWVPIFALPLRLASTVLDIQLTFLDKVDLLCFILFIFISHESKNSFEFQNWINCTSTTTNPCSTTGAYITQMATVISKPTIGTKTKKPKVAHVYKFINSMKSNEHIDLRMCVGHIRMDIWKLFVNEYSRANHQSHYNKRYMCRYCLCHNLFTSNFL